MSYGSSESRPSSGFWRIPIIVAVVLGLLLVCGLLFRGMSLFGYLVHEVQENELGIKTIWGKFDSVLTPGTYSAPFEFGADIENIVISGIPFEAQDDEVLIRDAEQTIGVLVRGTIFRPRDPQVIEDRWSLYKSYYTDEVVLVAEVQQQARQAMKSCVGERNFEQAAVGQDRNDLRLCIETELTTLLSNYGVTVANVVVPNIVISELAKERIDAITDAQNQAQVALAEATRVLADSERDIAQRQAEIRVTQGAIQEGFRQQATAGAIQLTSIAADREVSAAQLELENFEAQRREEIQIIQLRIDQLVAQSETVTEAQIAQIVQSNPRYAQFLRDQLTAEALGQARLVYLAAGTNPLQIIGDSDNVMLSLDAPTAQPTPEAILSTPTMMPTPVQ
jgi:hypothetical protein